MGSLFAIGGCGSGSRAPGDDEPPLSGGEEEPDAGSSTTGGKGGAGGGAGASGGAGGATKMDASAGGSGGARGGAGGNVPDGGVIVPPPPIDCAGALFCENFDTYPTVTTIADRQKFGPWQATLKTGATMVLDGLQKVSGSSALHVHIDNTVTAGGRLFASGNRPIFAAKPTHLYGRMMMYINPNGTSVHWTFFGASGPAEPSSPVAGIHTQYILSSLAGRTPNTYAFVYGQSNPAGYHDCSSRATTQMPSTWACVSFELDSVARKLRMYKDGAATPILSIDDHGKACVPPTNVNDPWYGPVVNQLFVGAWSFHPMNAPLDVWIDDLVVDTKPVSCPAPPR